MEHAKVYPLSLPEAERKPMEFPNASGVAANMLPRTTAEAFDQLKWLLDREGGNLAGPGGLGLLANVGLIAGEPFEPDDATRALLDAAATTGYKMSRVIGMAAEVGGQSFLIWPNRRWVNPANNAAEPGPGPEAPDGQEANWLATAPGRGFFAILRLYGPGERAIDYSCKPGDFEKLR